MPTAIEALHILRSHPEMPKRLVELGGLYAQRLLERGIAIRDSITPIIPIYTYDVMRTLRKAKELFDAGVYVNPVLPPATPPGESLLRTSYMANHTETILDEALDIIERIVKMTDNPKRIVLITGASGGIGLAAAKLFFANGDRVYGLSRRPCPEEGIESICAMSRTRLPSAMRLKPLSAVRVGLTFLSAMPGSEFPVRLSSQPMRMQNANLTLTFSALPTAYVRHCPKCAGKGAV